MIPVIEAGREAEIEALFAGVGKGTLSGWKLEDIHIQKNQIIAGFSNDRGGSVELRLAYPINAPGAVARTPAFEFFISSRSKTDERATLSFVQTLAASVSTRAKPTFWRKWIESTTSQANKKPSLLRRWLWSAHGLSTLGWQAGLLALCLLVGIAATRRRCWRSAQGRRALIEMFAVFILALVVRWLLLPAGPGNFYHHLPDPNNPRLDIDFLGPGHGAWVLLWTWILGAGDSVVFFSGALCGAATVMAAYVLVWGSTSRQTWGLFAAVSLALWPVHALLSPTDDAYGLASLLFLAGLALVVQADKWSSPALLLAGWLAGLLAAVTRPDFGLIVLFLGGLVLWLPGTRKMQFRTPWLASTFLMGATALIVFLLATENRPSFDLPLGLRNLGAVGCIVGIHPGSVLRPPWTPWALLVLTVAGLPVALRSTRGKAVLWLLAALTTPVIFWDALEGDIISARYQVLMSAVAALFAGTALAWIWGWGTARRRIAAVAAAGLALVSAAWHLGSPPPEPTFRLEYKYFRKHIGSVPPQCEIMKLYWSPDLGLHPPHYLSNYLELGHEWVETSLDADVENKCVVYWKPAVCSTVVDDEDHPANECQRIQNAYRLVPISETRLPARSGHVEAYVNEEVTVGFYRLRPR